MPDSDGTQTGQQGAKTGSLGLERSRFHFGTLCAFLSTMNDLRPLRRIAKTAPSLLGVLVIFAIGGVCQAGEATTKPAPLGFGSSSGNGGGDIAGLMWQMLAAALVVLVIGGVALFVIKRLLPRVRGISQRQISVLETAYLGSRKAVHLLQVGSVKLLIASSPDGVVRLDDVTGAFPVEYADVALRAGAETDTNQRAGGPGDADSNAW